MNRFFHIFVLLSLLLSAAPSVRAQAADPTDLGGTFLLKRKARTVAVDIVVTDRDGQPVKNLHKENFEALEDGRSQPISFFQEHGGNQNSAFVAPSLPPNVFTNIPRAPSGDAVTVLLMDSLNTQLKDQSLVRKQTLKYLDELKPGQRMAVFTLNNRLRYVQGFTGDPAALKTALETATREAGPQTSNFIQSEGEADGGQRLLNTLAAEPGNSAKSFGTLMNSMEMQESKDNSRLLITLDAFQQLARYLAGIPGRKNVVWFSGSFPFTLLLDSGVGTSPSTGQDFEKQIKKTSAALVAAQVAIYPVAAQGLAGTAVSIDRDLDHGAMDEIARATGGQAIYNSNGLGDALARVVEQGSFYYTLYYTPSKNSANGEFRKIKIKLAGGKYKLTYRQGYYAVDEKTGPAGASPAADPLQPFMKPGLPNSTEIPIAMRVQSHASVVPNVKSASNVADKTSADKTKSQGALTHYAVDFVIAVKGLQLESRADGGRHGGVEAALVVYDQEGKPLNWMVRQVNLGMDAARYAQVQENGINFRLEIDSPAKAAALRGGIYDLDSHLAGTLEVPLDQLVDTSASTHGARQ